jgi:amidohydrolase
MTKTISMLERALEMQKEIIDTRRYLHQNPELSFEEHETAKLSAERLKANGYQVSTQIAKTGVAADIGAGKTVAIRADMDALPINEENNVAYKSRKPGVMHACGHDAHVACGLAAAKLLSQENNLSGRIRMLMQPAEEDVDSEGKSGAKRMIEAGVMDGVSAVIGLHMDATLPAGKVAIMPGPVMAAADCFKAVIHGKGGHGGYPETTVDAVVLATTVVQAIQQIVSRRIAAIEPAIITVGSMLSSSVRGNVISDQVVLLGTVRSFNEETRKKLIDEIEKTCSIANVLGGSHSITWEFGYPATVNEPLVTEVMHRTACSLIGAENVVMIPKKTWAEDFSMLGQVAPGAFMFLGGEIAGDRRNHHTSKFDLDETGLYIGSAILAETAKELLKIQK